MAGFHRAVPRHLFSANRDRATLADTPLIDALTPHKLFRRSFVEQHGLRFPEGRRRLEDHVFVVGAYFAAGTISVISDYVCYYHIRREDRSNAGLRPLEPEGYFGNLREVLDIVDAKAADEHLRVSLLSRFARKELLGRLRDQSFLDHPEDYRRELYRAIHGVIVDRIPSAVDHGLAPWHRVQMALVRADRLDLLIELAAAEVTLKASASLRAVARDDSAVRVAFGAGMTMAGKPMANDMSGGTPLLPVPSAVSRVVDPIHRALPGPSQPTGRLILRKRDDWAELVAPGSSSVRLDGSGLAIESEVTIDPATISLGLPIWPGRWDVLVRVDAFGSSRDARLRRLDGGDPLLGVGAFEARRRPRWRATPYWTQTTNQLAVHVVVAPVPPLRRRIRSRARRIARKLLDVVRRSR
jgi:hypothetical protein